MPGPRAGAGSSPGTSRICGALWAAACFAISSNSFSLAVRRARHSLHACAARGEHGGAAAARTWPCSSTPSRRHVAKAPPRMPCTNTMSSSGASAAEGKAGPRLRVCVCVWQRGESVCRIWWQERSMGQQRSMGHGRAAQQTAAQSAQRLGQPGPHPRCLRRCPPAPEPRGAAPADQTGALRPAAGRGRSSSSRVMCRQPGGKPRLAAMPAQGSGLMLGRAAAW